MKSGMHGRVNHINQKEGTCIIETTAGKLKFNKSLQISGAVISKAV